MSEETLELNTRIDTYYEARERYEKAKEISNKAEKEWRAKEHELVNYMIENQIKSVSRADGTKPLLVSQVSISCTADNAEEIREWLKEKYGDDRDFLVTTPHKPTVLAKIKQEIEEGSDPTDFPQFLSVNTRPTLRVDGWTKRGS